LVALGAKLRLNDGSHVVSFLGGKVDQPKRIGHGYEPKIIFGDVAHEEKLAGKELAVHLRSLNRKQQAETANSFSVQSLPGVRPGKGVGVEVIPCVDKGHDGFPERCNRGEMIVVQALPLENAEPYLNHVQPGRMERHEVNDNAFVGRLEPLAALGSCFEGHIGTPLSSATVRQKSSW
jgi:hypothetical protein